MKPLKGRQKFSNRQGNRVWAFKQRRCASDALLPLRGGIGQTPTAFCRPAGWDEGCGGHRPLEPLDLRPSPQPLSRKGRGAFFYD
ncbi:hypothetical protein F1643_06980 [Azospirillum sp. INR13]|nr:hypothetical protein [Azospirillum sp. INR13]